MSQKYHLSYKNPVTTKEYSRDLSGFVPAVMTREEIFALIESKEELWTREGYMRAADADQPFGAKPQAQRKTGI